MKLNPCVLACLFVGLMTFGYVSRGATTASATQPLPPSRRPNVLIITTDEQAITALSCAGNPYLRTPTMDRLAAQGVRFEKSYCAAPVCAPSRGALVTGRMPHETGVEYNIKPLRPGIPTIGDVFRRRGYETAWTGKWHMPSNYPEPASGEVVGYDVLPLPKTPQRPFMGDDNDAMVTDAAIAFLARPHDRPFLLHVSLLNPHDICYHIMGKRQWPKAPSLDGEGGAPPLPPNFAEPADEPEFIHLRRNDIIYGAELQHVRNWTEADWRNYLYIYYRMVERADVQVGRLLDALAQAGHDRDTLVVFTSDHGEGFGAHRWVTKLSLYDNPARVPLIVRWPGMIPQGKVDHDHLASGVDLMPTLCDYAGLAAPPDCRGRSLRPILEDPASPWRQFVVSEMATDPERPEVMARMVRTARYKYIGYSIGKNNEQLFDLQTDPGEMHNLAAAPDMADELKRHRELLARWVQETSDHFNLARASGASSP